MRFLKKREVAQRVGYHPVQIMRLVKNRKFPQPVRLNDHTVAFLEEEVDAWMQARVEERQPEGAPEAA